MSLMYLSQKCSLFLEHEMQVILHGNFSMFTEIPIIRMEVFRGIFSSLDDIYENLRHAILVFSMFVMPLFI